MKETKGYFNKISNDLDSALSKNAAASKTRPGDLLTVFLREDMKQMKETKGYFNKISNDPDSALSKNAAASKTRPGDLEDASNLLTATRSCFRYTGMDYVYQISMLQKRKKHVVLDSLSSFMAGYSTLFHQGTGLLNNS